MARYFCHAMTICGETVVNPRTNLKVLEMLISVDPTGPTVPSYDDTDVVNPGLPWAA
jgi:hypothetical protein